MRIRQVKPSFWTDPVIASVSYPARLFYIGLWNAADDSGWIEWEPRALGAALFPYETPGHREKAMAKWTLELEGVQRLDVMDCGCAIIPTLPRHQRITGKQSFHARDKHQREHGKHSPLTGKHSPCTDSPGSGSGTVVVVERNGSARDALNGQSTVEYDREVEAKIRARLQVVS